MNDCVDTHLNSSNGKVVFGGSPGLNVTIKKKRVKLMTMDASFFPSPILDKFCQLDFHSK